MFEETRTLAKVLNCFTSTSKTEDEIVRNAVKRIFLNHKQSQFSLGSPAPSIEKVAGKVIGYVLFTRENLGLARIKR